MDKEIEFHSSMLIATALYITIYLNGSENGKEALKALREYKNDKYLDEYKNKAWLQRDLQTIESKTTLVTRDMTKSFELNDHLFAKMISTYPDDILYGVTEYTSNNYLNKKNYYVEKAARYAIEKLFNEAEKRKDGNNN